MPVGRYRIRMWALFAAFVVLTRADLLLGQWLVGEYLVYEANPIMRMLWETHGMGDIFAVKAGQIAGLFLTCLVASKVGSRYERIVCWVLGSGCLLYAGVVLA